jgi:hypothetical protein
MLSKLRPRSVYDVVAALALFIALGGTAWAVAANSVGTTQLKDGAVTKPKLASDSVGTGKVINGSLLREDFQVGQLPFGAKSFDLHLDNHKFGDGPTVNGMRLRFKCDQATDQKVFIEISSLVGNGNTVYAIGTQAKDGSLEPVRSSDFYQHGALATLDFNVMARVNPGGRWTGYQLGAGWSGNPIDGCNFSGLITPGS